MSKDSSSLLADFEFSESLIKSVVDTALRQRSYAAVERGGALLARFAGVRDELNSLLESGLSEEEALAEIMRKSSSRQ